MSRVALYLRQSIDLSEGIERQRARCLKLAEARNWEVVGEYVDNDTSATKPRGPKTAWGKLIADATAGSFDIVISVDMDRLLRTLRDLVTITDSGVKVATVDGEIDLTTADGEFRATMAAGLAQFETRRKSERTQRADAARAADGIPRPGRRAWGYETDGITVRENEAYWMRWAYEQIIGGRSLYRVTADLNEAGVPTTNGNTWRPVLLGRTLKNPRNAGVFIAKGVRQPVSQIEAIVTEDEQAQLLASLRPDANTRPGPKPVVHYLAGLIYCDVCGSPMRYKSINYKGSPFPNYMCEKKVYNQAVSEKHRNIRAHIVEDRMPWEVFVVMLQADPATLQDEQERGALVGIQGELQELARQRETAQELYMLPGADKTSVTKKLAAIGERIETLEAQLLAIRSESAQMTVREVMERAGLIGSLRDPSAMADLYERFAEFEKVWADLDMETRRELVRGTVKVSITEGNRFTDRLSIESLI